MNPGGTTQWVPPNVRTIKTLRSGDDMGGSPFRDDGTAAWPEVRGFLDSLVERGWPREWARSRSARDNDQLERVNPSLRETAMTKAALSSPSAADASVSRSTRRCRDLKLNGRPECVRSSSRCVTASFTPSRTCRSNIACSAAESGVGATDTPECGWDPSHGTWSKITAPSTVTETMALPGQPV